MKHKHIYDEHGLCFECDKPKPRSKAELMRETRQRRRDAGLVEFRAWVTPVEREAITLALRDIRAAEACGPVIDELNKNPA